MGELTEKEWEDLKEKIRADPTYGIPAKLFQPFEIRVGPEPGMKIFKVHPEARCHKSIRSMLGLYRNDNKVYEIEIRVRESDSPGGSCQAESEKG